MTFFFAGRAAKLAKRAAQAHIAQARLLSLCSSCQKPSSTHESSPSICKAPSQELCYGSLTGLDRALKFSAKASEPPGPLLKCCRVGRFSFCVPRSVACVGWWRVGQVGGEWETRRIFRIHAKIALLQMRTKKFLDFWICPECNKPFASNNKRATHRWATHQIKSGNPCLCLDFWTRTRFFDSTPLSWAPVCLRRLQQVGNKLPPEVVHQLDMNDRQADKQLAQSGMSPTWAKVPDRQAS